MVLMVAVFHQAEAAGAQICPTMEGWCHLSPQPTQNSKDQAKRQPPPRNAVDVELQQLQNGPGPGGEFPDFLDLESGCLNVPSQSVCGPPLEIPRHTMIRIGAMR